LGKRATSEALGLKLTDKQVNELRDDQIGQLFELFQEIQRPSSASQDATESDRQTTEAGTKSPLVDEGGSRSAVDRDSTAESHTAGT